MHASELIRLRECLALLCANNKLCGGDTCTCSNWASFPAIQNVNVNCNNIMNVLSILGCSGENIIIQPDESINQAGKSLQVYSSDLSFTPTIKTAITTATSYVGTFASLTAQNNDTGNNSSVNMYLCGANSTETDNFSVLGRNNQTYTASNAGPTTMDGAPNNTYLANVNGSISIIPDYFESNNNSGIHLAYSGGTKAVSIKSNTGEISLGTTFQFTNPSNPSTATYTYKSGTSGQFIMSQGPGSPAIWSNLTNVTIDNLSQPYSSAGASSSKYLRVIINGTPYKIALLADV